MTAFIPKGTPLDPDLGNIRYPEFLDFLKGQHGIFIEPPEKILDELKHSFKHNPYGFKSNFELATGIPPREGKPASLIHVKHEGIPEDMALDGVPFMEYRPGIEPEDGLNVHGEKVPASRVPDPLKELVLPDELIFDENNKIVPSASGQIIRNGNILTFKPVYKVNDPTEPIFQSMEFYSNVLIDGDLAGNMNWKIYGDLTVEGHLSAPHLEIFGNLEVKQGIQTNMEGVIRVHGSVKTGYLQMSRIGVGDSLIVERGILQCEVRAGALVRCSGSPGAIQGSKVFCLGSITANRAGSDQGIKTELEMPYIDQTKPIKITSVSDGTRIIFKNKSWTASGKSTFQAVPDDLNKAS